MKISLVLVSLVVVVLLTVFVDDGDTLYPYAIKGFVRDVKLKPHLFIGTLALKKFIKLKLFKLKFILYKKLKIKKKIKLALIFHLLKKIKKGVRRFRGRYSRNKRQVEDYVPYSPEELNQTYEYEDYEDLPGKEPSDEEIMPYITMANELDSDACLPKGVCEVVAKGNGSHLNHFENMVYDLYGEGNYPKSPRDSPLYAYEYAAYIGKTSRDVRTCEQTFNSCSEQPQKLNQFMESTFTTEMCDIPDQQVYASSNSQTYSYDDLNPNYDPGRSQFYSQPLQASQSVQRPSGTIKFE